MRSCWRRSVGVAALSAVAAACGATTAQAHICKWTGSGASRLCVLDESTIVYGSTYKPKYYGNARLVERVGTTDHVRSHIPDPAAVSYNTHLWYFAYKSDRTVERQAAGGAPVMIVLHGGGGSPRDSATKRWARWWARQGYLAIVPYYIDEYSINNFSTFNANNYSCMSAASPPDWHLVDKDINDDGVIDITSEPPPVSPWSFSASAWTSPRAQWCAQRGINNLTAGLEFTGDTTASGWDAVARNAQRNVQTLVRMLKLNAASYGINKHRVSAMGESFGAITALRLATRSEDYGDAAIRAQHSGVNSNAPTAAENRQNSRIFKAISISGTECHPGFGPLYYQRGVPWNWGSCTWKGTKDDAPFLMFHGTEDQEVKVEHMNSTCTAGQSITTEVDPNAGVDAASKALSEGYKLCAGHIKYWPATPGNPTAGTCVKQGTNPITGLDFAPVPGRDHFIAGCEWNTGISAASGGTTSPAGTNLTAYPIACWAWRFLENPHTSTSPTCTLPN